MDILKLYKNQESRKREFVPEKQQHALHYFQAPSHRARVHVHVHDQCRFYCVHHTNHDHEGDYVYGEQHEHESLQCESHHYLLLQTLSQRYISDRFLPDKAIDLIDEAASKLRIEIDSMPEELDIIEKKIKQLEIEREALKRELT